MDPLNNPLPPHADDNMSAQFIVPERHPPALGGDRPAGISLAGAVVSAWVTPDGDYMVSFDFTQAADRLRGDDGTVGLRVVVAGAEGGDVYAGRHLPPDPPEEDSGGVVVPMYGHDRRPPYAG